MDRPRDLEAPIREDLAAKMVFLAGPREVGKTTLARRILAQWQAGTSLSWDNRSDRKEIHPFSYREALSEAPAPIEPRKELAIPASGRREAVAALLKLGFFPSRFSPSHRARCTAGRRSDSTGSSARTFATSSRSATSLRSRFWPTIHRFLAALV